MTVMADWRQALEHFVADLRGLYGTRLESVILYGSRARGDGGEESDIDTLVVLDPGANFWSEFDLISPIASRVSLQYDVVISAIPVDSRDFRASGSPLFLNVHREGVRVS